MKYLFFSSPLQPTVQFPALSHLSLCCPGACAHCSLSYVTEKVSDVHVYMCTLKDLEPSQDPNSFLGVGAVSRRIVSVFNPSRALSRASCQAVILFRILANFRGITFTHA